MKRTIIIMAKVPRAGNVKTRLQPYLSGEECRTLAEAFLFDAIDKTRSLCDELIIAFASANEKDYFAKFAAENLILIEQTGADLGEKMFNAFESIFESNSNAGVLMIGTDSPSFPSEFIEDAFTALESGADAVLGKSADGGFYLIGLRENPFGLFEQIEWSSPKVFGQITDNINSLNLDLRLQPEWFDVDTLDDLRRLREEMLSSEQMQKRAAQTFRWLIEHAEIFERET